MDTRKLKDRAAHLLAKGKLDKAVELYEELVNADPRDLQLKVRLGDVYRRAAHPERAIATYREVVDRYARDGLLLKAIAVCKIVLEVDPEHGATQKLLADLYARKYGKGSPQQATGALASVPIALTEAVRPEHRADAIELDEPELPADAPVPVDGRAVVREERHEEVPLREASAAPPILLQTEAELPPELELPEAPSVPIEDEGLDVVDGEEIDLDGAIAEAASSRPEPEIEVEEPHAPGITPESLPQIPLFSELGKSAFIALLETCELRRVEADEQIITQGEPGTSFFVVVSGGVTVIRHDDAVATELATLGEGAFFGEMALLSGGPRLASVIASGPTELLEFPRKAMDQLVREHPTVGTVLQRFARQRLLSNVMATSPLFRPFDRHERKALIEKFKSREVDRGEVIIAEGDPVDGLYVVLSGAVSVSRKEGSRKVNLATLREGELFGEISLLTKKKATATCSARRRSTVLRLPKKTFDEVILTHPQILELVAELTEERQQKTEAILSGRIAVDEDGVMLV